MWLPVRWSILKNSRSPGWHLRVLALAGLDPAVGVDDVQGAVALVLVVGALQHALVVDEPAGYLGVLSARLNSSISGAHQASSSTAETARGSVVVSPP
ncbi:hypothetical protein BFF78_11025 [Streptomyces fodineus]|uniref:Uncharacterized protein n=1 Tax=Streptomyces fodineus TaxID=1904616 RepID=A0A1D7Y7C5_9ACTN|nr:hypothetical protein BFF78_11025 [Streptomyces fodineus]